MLECLNNFATGRNLRIAMVVFIVALTAINVAATLFYNATGGYGILDLGGGANLFDDRGSYTPDRAYALIAHYGQAGIQGYYGLLLADILFPATLGLFALLAIATAMRRIAPRQQWPYALALLPLAYTLADWCENAGILAMLLNYPQELYQVATVTNTLRGIKGALATASLLLAGGSWLFAILTRRRPATV
ncbi:MAG TPA: hypothetical protein VGE50_03380 [Gammaproteobacteria bacterium]